MLTNLKKLIKKGSKEVVLSGINIGDYGIYDLKSKKRESNFNELINEIDKIKFLNRVRISSIEPNLLTDSIIKFVSESKIFVNHFHIPLQSGSDEILKSMKRRYLTQFYKERILKIKELMPDCCIGVDVIVGFPGESDDDFEETFKFLTKLDVSYLHVFSYSERDNTESIHLKNKVSNNIKSQRSKILRGLSLQKKKIFYEKNLTETRSVLFESKNNDGYILGYTDNYVRVRALWSKKLVDRVINCELIELNDDLIVKAKPLVREITVSHQ